MGFEMTSNSRDTSSFSLVPTNICMETGAFSPQIQTTSGKIPEYFEKRRDVSNSAVLSLSRCSFQWSH